MGTLNRERWDAQMKALGLRGKVPGKLTEEVVKAAQKKPLGHRYALADGEVAGLSLQVGAMGSASFVLAYETHEGTRTRMAVAPASVPLKEARKLALAAVLNVKGGGDPLKEKRDARTTEELTKSSTVRAYLADVYAPKVLAHKKAGGVPKEEGGKPGGSYGRILAAWEPLLDHQLEGLTRDAIETVLADRKDDGLAMGTLIRDWSAFRAMLSDATTRRVPGGEGRCYLAAVPMTKRPEPIKGKKGAERIRWLGQHDAEDVRPDAAERARFNEALEDFPGADACTGDFLRFAARLALATGLRRGEIVRLTDKMISLREKTIVLPPEITKSEKERKVYLGAAAVAAIKGWAVRGTSGELCPGSADMWNDRITKQGWPVLCAAAGISDLHFHDLRHDFAVRLLRSGATLDQVREALGHASITQTEKYAHTIPSDVRKAVLALQA